MSQAPHPVRRAYASVGLLIGRVVLGLILVLHGYNTIFNTGTSHVSEQLGATGIPNASVVGPIIGWAELVGGALLIVGLFTPVIALLLAVALAVLAFANGSQETWRSGAWALPAALAAGSTILATVGAGALSLDHLLFVRPARRRRELKEEERIRAERAKRDREINRGLSRNERFERDGRRDDRDSRPAGIVGADARRDGHPRDDRGRDGRVRDDRDRRPVRDERPRDDRDRHDRPREDRDRHDRPREDRDDRAAGHESRPQRQADHARDSREDRQRERHDGDGAEPIRTERAHVEAHPEARREDQPRPDFATRQDEHTASKRRPLEERFEERHPGDPDVRR